MFTANRIPSSNRGRMIKLVKMDMKEDIAATVREMVGRCYSIAIFMLTTAWHILSCVVVFLIPPPVSFVVKFFFTSGHSLLIPNG